MISLAQPEVSCPSFHRLPQVVCHRQSPCRGGGEGTKWAKPEHWVGRPRTASSEGNGHSPEKLQHRHLRVAGVRDEQPVCGAKRRPARTRWPPPRLCLGCDTAVAGATVLADGNGQKQGHRPSRNWINQRGGERGDWPSGGLHRMELHWVHLPRSFLSALEGEQGKRKTGFLQRGLSPSSDQRLNRGTMPSPQGPRQRDAGTGLDPGRCTPAA